MRAVLTFVPLFGRKYRFPYLKKSKVVLPYARQAPPFSNVTFALASVAALTEKRLVGKSGVRSAFSG